LVYNLKNTNKMKKKEIEQKILEVEKSIDLIENISIKTDITQEDNIELWKQLLEYKYILQSELLRKNKKELIKF